jgi:IS66 Orf2 like protein
MLTLALPSRIFVCTQPADMRRSFDGLAALVEQHLGCDPLSGDLFVFRSKRGDRVKLLYWNGVSKKARFPGRLPTARAQRSALTASRCGRRSWPCCSTASS